MRSSSVGLVGVVETGTEATEGVGRGAVGRTGGRNAAGGGGGGVATTGFSSGHASTGAGPLLAVVVRP